LNCIAEEASTLTQPSSGECLEPATQMLTTQPTTGEGQEPAMQEWTTQPSSGERQEPATQMLTTQPTTGEGQELAMQEWTTQPSSGERQEPATQVWTRTAVLKLLSEVKIRYCYLTDRLTKNKHVWREVAAVLREEIPGISDSQCDQKWRNLKQQYRKYVDNQKKTGRGKMVVPEFFEEIDEILGSAHSVNPPYVKQTGSVAASAAATSGATATCVPALAQPSAAAGSATTGASATTALTTASPVTDVRLTDLGETRRRKRIRPPSTRERLETQLNEFIKKQEEGQLRQDQRLEQMSQMFQKQHEDRMGMMKELIAACGKRAKKTKKSKQQQQPEQTSSESS